MVTFVSARKSHLVSESKGTREFLIMLQFNSNHCLSFLRFWSHTDRIHVAGRRPLESSHKYQHTTNPGENGISTSQPGASLLQFQAEHVFILLKNREKLGIHLSQSNTRFEVGLDVNVLYNLRGKRKSFGFLGTYFN